LDAHSVHRAVVFKERVDAFFTNWGWPSSEDAYPGCTTGGAKPIYSALPEHTQQAGFKKRRSAACDRHPSGRSRVISAVIAANSLGKSAWLLYLAQNEPKPDPAESDREAPPDFLFKAGLGSLTLGNPIVEVLSWRGYSEDAED
jgi:hypothetical protein